MHLFNEVRSRYGQPAVKHVRDLENTGKKLARHRQHLTFTHRCKDNGITPSSLKIRCPINTEKARNIVKKAEKELIGERIRVVNNKIKYLQRKQESQKNHLETLDIDPEVIGLVENHLEITRKSVENKTKERHKEKLNQLKTKHEAKIKSLYNSEPDLSGTQLKKWLENGLKTSLINRYRNRKRNCWPMD